MNCLACKEHVHIAERIKCCSCKGVYHCLCLNISKAEYTANAQKYDLTWQCPDCSNITKRQRNDNTPVRNIYLSNSSLNESYNNVLGDTFPNNSGATNMEELSVLLDTKLKAMQQSIVTQISTTIEEKISLTLQKFKQDFILEFTNLKSKQQTLIVQVEEMDKKIQKLEDEKKKIKEKLEKLSADKVSQNPIPQYENSNKCENVKKFVLYGLNETYDEDEYNLNYRIINIFHELYNVDLTGFIEDVSRIGRKGNCRPLMVELISKRMTKYLLQNAIHLKNTGLYISEYYDENGRRERKQMQEALRTARKNGKHAIIRNNRLIINGKEIDLHDEEPITANYNEDLQNPNSSGRRNLFRN